MDISHTDVHGSGIVYRVDSLSTRYLTAKGIIPEGLNSIGQF